MPEAAKAELLRGLGRLLRGLAALFWGLGLTGFVYLEMVYLETAPIVWRDTFSPWAFAPALFLSLLLWHGLNQMRDFQPQERIWQRALSRAQVFAVLDAGLAPFLYWWHRFPTVPLFNACASLLLLGSVFLLLQINGVLRRLCAMLPDQTLRSETSLFTRFNISLLVAFLFGLGLYLVLTHLASHPEWLNYWMESALGAGIWLALFLILMPLTMTMALLWKIKEVIFGSLTNGG